MRFFPIDSELKRSFFQPFASYGQSKTANILFSVGLTKRFSKDGIYSTALMPGYILTELQRSLPLEIKKQQGMIKEDGSKNHDPSKMKTPEQGAATTIYACVAPELENRGGLYLNDCHICTVSDAQAIMAGIAKFEFLDLVADYAVNEAAADRLWEISEKSITK